jgi:hypothetical protein
MRPSQQLQSGLALSSRAPVRPNPKGFAETMLNQTLIGL